MSPSHFQLISFHDLAEPYHLLDNSRYRLTIAKLMATVTVIGIITVYMVLWAI